MGPATGIGVSAVIPCLNEAGNVAAIGAAVIAELEKADVSFEIIFIDNGSTDGSVEIIKSLCADDGRVRLIVNNQNYGQLRSPTHGIFQTRGDAVIGISADFQDPPSLIGELLQRWRSGALIVLGVRASEDTSLFLRTLRTVGYRFFERFGDYRVIPGATGFGLYDRRVVDSLREWRDPEPFFRGMLVESGYRLETIPYHRPRRRAGRTKNDFGTLLSFALTGLAASSKRLLRLPFVIAALSAVATGAGLAVGAIRLATGHSIWTLLVFVTIQVNLTIVFFFLGLMGDQIRIIAQTVRRTPLVLEKERVNFPDP